MPTPRRRSSRIKGEKPSQCNATPLASKLSSLIERDESPPSGAPHSLNTIVSSPLAPPNTAVAQTRFTAQSSPLKTPQTSSRIHPAMEEMHPSKVQQSTIKPSPSRQGFGSILARMTNSPSKPTLIPLPQQTPSKSKCSLPNKMTSPTFDFSFERPESDLSVEAQKIMDSVREEAAKIKAQMIEERSKQEHKDGETDQLYGVGGRKIAKPKGKCGRYSDVHKQEFKKMDSIAGHASVWKNKVDANVSLKRSPSKAGLDEPLGKLPRSKSFRNFGQQLSSDRLENTSPGKRAKQNRYDDTSSARPVSRDTDSELGSAQMTSAKERPQSGLPSAVTTPTKASLARSASVKSMKSSMIPSLSRSASTKTLGSPVAPKTEGSNKYLSSLSRFGSMKSILHRSQPKFSNDPVKVAAGTHLPLPRGKMDLEKELPSVPATPLVDLHRSPTMKRVIFTPSTKSQYDPVANSPSPSKIQTRPQHQSVTPSGTPQLSDSITYPDLGNSPNINTRTKIPRASTPGDFTFRSEKTIDFHTASPTTVTSPGNTIRHVRPSGISTPLPAFNSFPSIPHGMSNKKRRRAESDAEVEDEENVDPRTVGQADDDQPKAKKQRMNTSLEKTADAPSPSKRQAAGSRIPKLGGAKEKGRKGISLGRLNMLARPKERR